MRQTEIQTMEARALRQARTQAERLVWERLRARRLDGLKFRRQVPLGPHVGGFYCATARLVVEIETHLLPDGRFLGTPNHEWFASAGLHLLQIHAEDVLRAPNDAAGLILRTARKQLP